MIKGVFTIKLFNKYIKDEDNSILEVYCDNLKRDEIRDLLTLLEGIKFIIISNLLIILSFHFNFGKDITSSRYYITSKVRAMFFLNQIKSLLYICSGYHK